MQFRTDWKRVATRAWSFRFNMIAIALSGAEVAVGILSNDPPLPRGTFAGLAMAVSIGAATARLVVQNRITPEDAR